MKKTFSLSFSVINLVLTLFLFSCKKDETTSNGNNSRSIKIGAGLTSLDFGNVQVGQSTLRQIQVSGINLTDAITITASEAYEVSLDNSSFGSSKSIPVAETGTAKTLYVRFKPTAFGVKNGSLQMQSPGTSNVTIALTGKGGIQQTYPTFFNKQLAFGTGLSQSAEQQFVLAPNTDNINKISMFVKLRCPAGNCGDWDVFAHVQVKDDVSGEWYELGRYITPYGVDNQATGRGFEIDVTDFKSMLQGTVTLRAFIEVWTADGWLLSVDFDYQEGVPDYPFYNIARVIQYNNNSLGGVIYGEDASAFDLTKSVTIPANAEATSLRTVITGWGEAAPYDSDGRPCAEWCFRTHQVKINGSNTFSHYMGPIGCPSNPVQPQGGNWQPDRAGWCPGMAVPVRKNEFSNAMAGQTFSFEYSFQPWVNNLSSPNPNPHAYYAISTFVVVKSNTAINRPIVID